MATTDKKLWAIAKSDGADALAVSSYLDFDIRSDSQIVNAPVEEGSFTSYNKTTQPIEISTSIGISGTDAELQEALAKVDTLKNGLELVSIVTPNAEYKNMNCVSYSYARKRENGVGVLWIDLEFQEVKQVAAAYTSVRLAEKRNTGNPQVNQSISKALKEAVKKRISGG